jgi:hypothetical protein
MFSAKDIQETLQRLAAQRPIFHSEADFQHALAWSVHQSDPNAVIRLEVPFRNDDYSEYLDLHIISGNQSFAVELKYKTRQVVHRHADEEFSLKQQGAQDIGRYDFLADVGRLERFVAAKRATSGCAILVTNDSSYWSASARLGTVDEKFRLSEGRIIHGLLAWHEHASAGTMRGRERPIALTGRYVAAWKPYSTPCAAPGGEFRFLAWHIL